MKSSLLLLTVGFESRPVLDTLPRHKRSNNYGYGGKEGSWDWFIRQIEDEHDGESFVAKPTESTRGPNVLEWRGPRTTAVPIRRQEPIGRATRTFGKTPMGAHRENDDSRFNWFTGRKKEQPVVLSARSGMPSFRSGSDKDYSDWSANEERPEFDPWINQVEFIGAENGVRTYSLTGGSGDYQDYEEEVQEYEEYDSYDEYYDEYYEDGDYEAGGDGGADRSDGYNEEGFNDQIKFGEGKSFGHPSDKIDMNNFVFHTATGNEPIQSQNTHFNPWAQYLSGAEVSSMSRFNDGEAIPVQLVNEWPSNDDALGGALFEVANFIYGSTGICTLDLPSSVYWFHTFNAHIVPSESNPSAGRYALVAANQAYEGVNTLDFIVNFQSDDLRFDASQIQLACDSTQTWTSSLSSFPGNTIGDVARTNIRRPADGNGFNNRRIVVEFPYNVTAFRVDDSRATVSSGGADPTAGKTFTIEGLEDTYLEELWMGWNYIEGGWFTASDTSITIIDTTPASTSTAENP